MDSRPRGELLPAATGAMVLLAAAMLPALRLPALAGLIAAAASAWIARRPIPIGLLATLPVALVLSWPAWLGGDVPLGPIACADPLSVIALRRVAAGAMVALLVAALVFVRAGTRASLGLRRPRPPEVAVAIVGGGAVALAGLVIGPALADPFFGPLAFERPFLALLPALAFGVANGVLEELAYRGVLQGLLGGVVGRWPAIVLQAAVFGISHVGPEVTALVPVHAALMAWAGLVAGLIVHRTGSLTIPIGLHIGADVALYFGLACRMPGA